MNIPKGYRLVPVEPTREMCLAAKHEHATYPGPRDANSPVVTYRAMLAAAPAPPQTIYDEAKERSTCRKEWELRNRHSHFEPVPFPDYWAGWKDRAQSRAKAGEDE